MATIKIDTPATMTPSQEATVLHWRTRLIRDIAVEIDGNNGRGDVLFWMCRPRTGWRKGRIGKRGRVYFEEERRA